METTRVCKKFGQVEVDSRNKEEDVSYIDSRICFFFLFFFSHPVGNNRYYLCDVCERGVWVQLVLTLQHRSERINETNLREMKEMWRGADRGARGSRGAALRERERAR